ncbi:MAG: cytochrome c oxidase assembly protein [Methylophilaceae bacterium]|jgi:cytochrome c oxidase assembly protein subunit 11|nr:MAG: cytochrome c oxidase assembly protein [Methylophilaceae bacterium]
MIKENTKTSNKHLAVRLIMIVVAGLAFGFAIAPLYDVVCKAIGLNGRADTTATDNDDAMAIDESRNVTVIFTGTTMPGLDWHFAANESTMTVHPGEIRLTSYQAINNGSQAVVGSAVPSVSPEVAALYFKKIECFCFNKQTLQPGEAKDMPIRFFVSPDLPKDIKTVTLSYAFYQSNDELN